jgi:hypothetical protein
VGGVSGIFVKGTNLSVAPPASNINAPGTVRILGLFDYLAGEQRLAEGAIAAISSETAFLDELEKLLSQAAEAEFFMEAPLLVNIDAEGIENLEVPLTQLQHQLKQTICQEDDRRCRDLKKYLQDLIQKLQAAAKPKEVSFLKPDRRAP